MFLSVMIDVVYITNCLDKARKLNIFDLLLHEKHVAIGKISSPQIESILGKSIIGYAD